MFNISDRISRRITLFFSLSQEDLDVENDEPDNAVLCPASGTRTCVVQRPPKMGTGMLNEARGCKILQWSVVESVHVIPERCMCECQLIARRIHGLVSNQPIPGGQL